MNPNDREILLKALSAPEMPEAADVTTLRRWLDAYPWFQGLHLLLLKKMHADADPSFTGQLHRSSWFVPDRKILWHLLHTPELMIRQALPKDPEPQLEPQPQPVVEVTSATAPEAKKEEDPKADLIKQFIQAEPRIVPREGSFESAVELAEKSNIPVFDLVTETLANVYLQQGNKSKAIKILEKLSLSMPEKSSYFAARIAEIKSLPNSL
ncbi:MAG TPA: hypothetical protein P5228_04030 [Bacteroidales bacterium]|nr:hypothetical protein [Bacteroidales bacterium]HRZ48423.1 hypothetical protein [Bacteroidales bacterium]